MSPRQRSGSAHALRNGAMMSGVSSDNAQKAYERQVRLQHYQNSPEYAVSQLFLERSSLPEKEPGIAGIIHGPDAPSIPTTNRSEAGGSVRDSSVAPPPSAGSSTDVLRSQSRHCHVSSHGARSDRGGKTGNDGIGDSVYAKSLRLAQQDGTVRTSLSQQATFLECLWGRMTGCEKNFHVANSAEWAKHMKEHFVLKEGRRGPTCKYIGPPTSNSCVFCGKIFQADSGDSSWSKLVNHVAEVHYMHGDRLTRIDRCLVEYLWGEGLLTSAQMRELKPMMNTPDLPSPPGLSDDKDPIVVVEGGRHRRG